MFSNFSDTNTKAKKFLAAIPKIRSNITNKMAISGFFLIFPLFLCRVCFFNKFYIIPSRVSNYHNNIMRKFLTYGSDMFVTSLRCNYWTDSDGIWNGDRLCPGVTQGTVYSA